MTSQEHRLSVQTEKKLHEELINGMIIRSCLNCVNYSLQSDLCVKFNAKPPARVIVFACDEWVPEIPF